jgi:hypothetical protein
VRLQLHALAYNLGNFLRTLATPEPIKDWSLTTLKEKLIKIGAKVVSHGRYVPTGRSHHQRHEAFDCHAFKSNRQEESVQMPVKIARSAPRPSFRLPELLVAIHTSRQSCSKAGKARIFALVWESSLRDTRGTA